MARVPDAEIERLKREVALERLVEAAGAELRRQGSDLVGRCPFHEDRTPSLVVSPEKNLWHCLGACQAGGSVIDWVMRCEGVSFRHAVELLRDGVAPTAAAQGRPPRRSSVKRLPSPLEPDVDDRELLERVAGFYHATLRESVEALSYLERRGLRSEEAIERFQLGYANRTLGYRLPDRNRQAGAELRGRLQRLGVLRSSGHEHLAGSLVVPLHDEHGRVCQLYGRKVRDDLRAGTPAHLYLPGPRRGLFNREALQASRELIVCEALFDALSFWVCGLRHVTAAFGTGGFTGEHLAALREHRTERVLIAFDADVAGDLAAAKLAERLIAEGIECFRVRFPPGADANALARSTERPAEALAAVLREAAWMGAGPAPKLRAASVAPAASQPATTTPQPPASEDEPDPPSPAAGPPPATPVPARPAEPALETAGEDEAMLELGERRWRVRGLSKVSSFDLLRLNVLVARDDGRGRCSTSTASTSIRPGRGRSTPSRPPTSSAPQRRRCGASSGGCCSPARGSPRSGSGRPSGPSSRRSC